MAKSTLTTLGVLVALNASTAVATAQDATPRSPLTPEGPPSLPGSATRPTSPDDRYLEALPEPVSKKWQLRVKGGPPPERIQFVRLFRYEPSKDAWIAVPLEIEIPDVKHSTSVDISQILPRALGLYYAIVRVDAQILGSMVYTAPALPNDVLMPPPPIGRVAAPVPKGADGVEVRYVPDPANLLEDSRADDDDAVKTIDYLLSLRHGPTRTNDRGRELFDRLRQEPEKYQAAVREKLMLPENDAALDGVGSPASLRLGRALGLAQALGREHGAPMVRDFNNALRKRLAEIDRPATAPTTAPAGTAPVPSHVATLRHLERGTLDVLGAFEDPTAIAYALDTIDTQEPATRTVMLRYLAALAKHDPTIRQRLRTIIERPTSPLNQDPFARSVLDSMATTQPAATTNSSSTMDEPSILHIQPGEDRATRAD